MGRAGLRVQGTGHRVLGARTRQPAPEPWHSEPIYTIFTQLHLTPHHMQPTLEQRRNRLFIVLAGIFITNALLAEIIGVKIFSAESTVGLQPAQLTILGFQMDFNLTAG